METGRQQSADEALQIGVDLIDYEPRLRWFASLDEEIEKLMAADANGDVAAVAKQTAITLTMLEKIRPYTKHDERLAWEQIGEAIDKYRLNIDEIFKQVEELIGVLDEAEQQAAQPDAPAEWQLIF